MQDFFNYPSVSIITVNLNGKKYLKDLFKSLYSLNYPQEKLEIILVDNNSTDGSVEYVKNSYPEVKIIKNNYNTGFAVANNLGARQAKGQYLAFLNNDMKVDCNWLIELIKPIYGDKEVICAGSKVLSIDGKNLDFAGSMINFEGKGFQIDYGLDIKKDTHHQYCFIPFANGGSMLVKKDVFLESGGFDEDFFAYYEDVDFGWRLWVLGYRVVFAPKSIAYHFHHGTSNIFSDDKLRFLKERNALYSVFKNYDDENLAKVFSASLISIYNRIFVDLKFDYKNYYDFKKVANADISAETNTDAKAENTAAKAEVSNDISAGTNTAAKAETDTNVKPETKDNLAANDNDNLASNANLLFSNKNLAAKLEIDSQPLSSLMAVKAFLDNIDKLRQKRQEIQKARKRDDKAVFTYFQGQFLAVSPDAEYQRTQIEVLKSLGIYDIFTKKIKRNLLIISGEVLSSKMAGPAIRVFNFAKVLSEYLNVTLAIPNDTDLEKQVFDIVKYTDEASIRNLLEKCDIVLCSGMTFSKFKSIRNSSKYIIMDIYDPYNLATLAEYSSEPIEKQFDVYKSIHFIANEMLYYGDFYICASERQRDFWLGMLAALNRLNPYSYNQDVSMRKLIDVVPFGLPSNKPIHTEKENVLKGKIAGIDRNDFVLLWGGGIYNWFDPLTLIKAMEIVWSQRKDIKLYFLGVKHPNPQVRQLSLAEQTIELAKRLNLYEKNVFFNYDWVDYDKRQNYFLEADVGIITHPDHIETRFAFRTRILDYLWTSLPIISTKGDSLSDLINNENLGVTVEAQNPKALADAIIYLAQDRQFYNTCRQNVDRVASNYTWEKVCKPIINFCMDPVSSAVRQKLRPDQIHQSTDVLSLSLNSNPSNTNSVQEKTMSYLLGRFFYHFFKSGPKKAMEIYKNYKKTN